MCPRFAMMDRDGTIVVQKHYLSDPDDIELIPGVASALCRLREMGLGLVVISNQSPIGRGLFNVERLEEIHQRLVDLLADEGAFLDGFFFCPHTPDDRCSCRKPAAGMVERAAQELCFSPWESCFVGDSFCDIEVGRKVGATTFLVRTGYGARVEKEGVARPDYVVDDLPGIVPIISRLRPASYRD